MKITQKLLGVNMEKLLLIDGNSIMNRAFYGLPELTTRDGRHTNAVLGFLNIVLKVIDEEKATHVCVAFDIKKKNFRHEMYAEYKGNRKSMPDELREQMPLIKEVLNAMNVTIAEKEGYEADDILGTLSKQGSREGYKVTVLSGDRDLLQLATDQILIRIPKTKAGKTIIESYYDNDVKELYGVDPITFIDMKGLMGDTSDNIPGVPSVGEKTASKLLVTYGSLDGIYDNISSMKEGKLKDKLIENKDLAYLSRDLATIKLDCELDISLAETIYENPFNEKSYDYFKDLEFKSLLSRFDGLDSDALSSGELEFEINVIEDFDSYQAMIKEISNHDTIAFEFLQGNDDIIGVSICVSESQVYVVKFINFINKEMVVESLKELFALNKTICCIDVKSQLPYIDINSNNSIFDCGVGAYLLNPLKDTYAYEDIALTFLNKSLPGKKELVGKKELNVFSFEDSEIQKYFGYISLIPFMAKPEIENKLKESNMLKLYYDIELPCVYCLYSLEKNGVKVDKDILLSFGDKLKERIAKLTEEIYSLCNEEFNINSTKQLGEILFEKLGLKSGKKTKTGYSTSVEVLEKIKKEHPVIPLILEYRQLTKLNSTYVEGLLTCIASDGRIHGKFNQTVTATGRISSTEPNLQNIPTRLPLGREIRKVFVPEDGYIFLDADYSQIELRVLAHMANDETLINAYKSHADIHSVTASEVFGVPFDEVDDLMRRKAKVVNFGIVYGISSFGLGQDLDISRKEAESYIEKYFDTYKGVKKYLDDIVSFAKKNGYSLTLFNRRRPIPELASSNFMTRSFGERAAMNSPIQGTAADIIKISMINVDRELKERKLKSKLILQVHDELIVETLKSEEEIVREIMVRNMMEAAKLSVELEVDINSGNSWYEAK